MKNASIVLVSLLAFSIASCKDAKKETRLDTMLRVGKTIGKVSGKTVAFAYEHSEKILSKKTLSTIILLAAPYLYFRPEVMSSIAEYGSEFVIRINGMIAEGIIRGVMRNPSAVANLAALLTAQSAGSAFVRGAGEKIGSLLLTLFTI